MNNVEKPKLWVLFLVLEYTIIHPLSLLGLVTIPLERVGKIPRFSTLSFDFIIILYINSHDFVTEVTL